MGYGRQPERRNEVENTGGYDKGGIIILKILEGFSDFPVLLPRIRKSFIHGVEKVPVILIHKVAVEHPVVIRILTVHVQLDKRIQVKVKKIRIFCFKLLQAGGNMLGIYSCKISVKREKPAVNLYFGMLFFSLVAGICKKQAACYQKAEKNKGSFPHLFCYG